MSKKTHFIILHQFMRNFNSIDKVIRQKLFQTDTLLLRLFSSFFQKSIYILMNGVIFLFLPPYFAKFRLQSGLVGGKSIQFCFQLFGGRKSGKSGLLDLANCLLKLDYLTFKPTQEFFLVL